MKKSSLLLVMLMLVTLTGCDFLRAVAGRPLSRDIDKKRIEIIKAEEAALQARLDSIAKAQEAAVQKAVRDSIDAFAYIHDNKVVFNNASKLGGISEDGLYDTSSGTRYRVVLGSFKDRNNAVKLEKAVSEAGDFWPHLIVLRTGMVAVAACPSDKIQNVVRGLRELKTKDVCPADAWILKCDE